MRQIEGAQFHIYLPQRIPVTKHFTSYFSWQKTSVKFKLLIYYTSQSSTASSGGGNGLGGICPWKLQLLAILAASIKLYNKNRGKSGFFHKLAIFGTCLRSKLFPTIQTEAMPQIAGNSMKFPLGNCIHTIVIQPAVFMSTRMVADLLWSSKNGPRFLSSNVFS